MMSMNAFAPNSSDEESSGDEDLLFPSTDPRGDDYNPRKRRRTGRDAKESATFGIFGSESEDDGPGWKKKRGLRGKGQAFVGAGQKQDEGEEEDDEEEEEEEEIKAPAKKRSTGVGAKFGTPLGKGFVPSSASIPTLRDDLDDDDMPRISRPSAFSTPQHGKKAGGSATPVNAGSFAARMMAKMGYQAGQGLGKDGQGRNNIIEAQLRPQGVGLGAVAEKSKQEKEEEKRQAKLKGEVYEDSDEERKKRRKRDAKAGGGQGSISTPKRPPKAKFRTVEEVQRAAPGLEIPEAFAPILDMTGPSQKLLTSSSGLLTPTATGAPSVESVEQAENKKLARRAQNDLSAFVEEWKNLQERKAYIEMETLQQQQEIDDYEKELDSVKAFADTIQDISQAVKDGQWDPVIQALTAADSLEFSGVNEELTSIAVAAIHPFLRQFIDGWQPLEDPKLNGLTPKLFGIRHILGATTDETAIEALSLNSSRRVKSTTPFETMIYTIVFPKVVSAINNTWDVHNPAPLLALLEAWEGLLPSFVRAQIFDQTIVSKLNGAVSKWNPRKSTRRGTEATPLPHLWLFPWLQYLSAHHADPASSSGLVTDIKRKFRTLIDAWDFHKGVIPGLQQWREVLAPRKGHDYWTPLIMNHVLPAMSKFLRDEKNFMVDPNDQSPYMAALQGIFAWTAVLKADMVGEVLVETMFPMWHSVLHQWLTVVGPNAEIGQWFEWWRDEVLPADIKALKPVQREFQKGHDMINTALDLGAKVSNLPAPSKPTVRKSTPPPAATTPAAKTQAVEPVSFRSLVEDWCIENDLQFLAEKKVLHGQGRPLYRITAANDGKRGTLVYFKGDSLWALQGKAEVNIRWAEEVGRDELLGMAWVGST